MTKKDAERAAALRKLFERERKRELEEQRNARARQQLSEQESHQPVSNRVSVSESVAFEPSYGSLGKTEAAADGEALEMLGEVGGADGVEYDVDALAVGDLQHLFGEVAFAVVDGFVRAEGLAVGALCVGTYCDDDLHS